MNKKKKSCFRSLVHLVLGQALTARVTHLFHVLRLRGGGVPAVVEDEDVGAGQTLVHLVEEELLL